MDKIFSLAHYICKKPIEHLGGLPDFKKSLQNRGDSRSYHTLSYPNCKKENLETYTYTMSDIQFFDQDNEASKMVTKNSLLSKSLVAPLQDDDQLLLSSIEKIPVNEMNKKSKQNITIKETKIEQHMNNNSCKICKKAFDNLKNSAKKLIKIYFMTTNVFIQGRNKECFKCKLCQKTERLRNYMERHILEHMVNNELTCEECQSKNPEIFTIISETKSSPNISKIVSNSWFPEKLVCELSMIPLYCKRCKIEFCHADNLLQYLSCSEVAKKASTEKEMQCLYICELCNDTGIGKAKSAMHIYDHIISEEVYCESCQPFIDKSNSMKPSTSFIQLWPEEPVQCSDCNNIIELDEILLIDVLSLNNNPKTKARNLNIVYFCNICHFKSYQKNRIAKHFRSHMEENYILCEKCQRSKGYK